MVITIYSFLSTSSHLLRIYFLQNSDIDFELEILFIEYSPFAVYQLPAWDAALIDILKYFKIWSSIGKGEKN